MSLTDLKFKVLTGFMNKYYKPRLFFLLVVFSSSEPFPLQVYNMFQHQSLGTRINIQVTKLLLLHNRPVCTVCVFVFECHIYSTIYSVIPLFHQEAGLVPVRRWFGAWFSSIIWISIAYVCTLLCSPHCLSKVSEISFHIMQKSVVREERRRQVSCCCPLSERWWASKMFLK